MPRGPRAACFVAALLLFASSIASPAGASPRATPEPAGRRAESAAGTVRSGPDSLSIDRLYRAIFLREPDVSGVRYWNARVARGRSLASVANEFARSPEFRARYGALDDEAFVHLVYRNVFGREADERGLGHWTTALSSRQLSRGSMLLAFSDSAEFKRRSGLHGDDVRVEVTARAPGRTELVVLDHSGRNAGPRTPALPIRTIHVRVHYPTDPGGAPRQDVSWPTLLNGSYRVGSTIQCAEERPSRHIHVCIGFPRMDHLQGVDFSDIPNHAGDVSVVLDALTADPSLAGLVDLEHVVYSGWSMGGMSGLLLASHRGHDPRIRAVVSWVGFAVFRVEELYAPSDWVHDGPEILMVNAHDDDVIPYELARRTVHHAPRDRIDFVTVMAGHGAHSPSCAPANEYVAAWTSHHLFGTALPSPSQLTGCAIPGVVPDGTTGLGIMDVLR